MLPAICEAKKPSIFGQKRPKTRQNTTRRVGKNGKKGKKNRKKVFPGCLTCAYGLFYTVKDKIKPFGYISAIPASIGAFGEERGSL